VTATRESPLDRRFLENLREALRAMAREAVTLSENNPAWDGAIGSVDDMRTLVESVLEKAHASKLAPPAPDDAPRFKVGDRVCPVPGEYRAEEVGSICCETTRANGAPVLMVEFPNRDHCAYAAHELTHADAPDDAKLVLRAADYLRQYTMFGGLADQLIDVSERIRTTLANGAGEVERLRAELADARRYLAETERTLEKKRGAFNFECSLRSTAERARLDAEKERDALRAELDEARRERDEALSKLGEVGVKLDFARADLDDARRALGQRDGKIAALESKLAAANGAGEVERLRAELAEAQRTIAFVRKEYAASREALSSYSEDSERERDALGFQKLWARKGSGITIRDLAALGEWRTWASDHGRECLMSDGANRAAIDRMLGEARRERDEARAELGRIATSLGFWRDWAEKAYGGPVWRGDHDSRALIESKLAAAKAGPDFTAEERDAVNHVAASCADNKRHAALTSVIAKIETQLWARGETEVGK
jgi:predicted  nucleic acid-binding Zn-ribbon protein